MMHTKYFRRQLALLGSLFAVGVALGLLVLLADHIFSRPEVPRADALLGFLNPAPAMAWLFITWILLLGAEAFGVGIARLDWVRGTVAEAFISVWGWFCGFAAALYGLGAYLEQIDGAAALTAGITLVGMTLIILGVDGALQQVSSDPRRARAIRCLALLAGLILICAYPTLSRWNAAEKNRTDAEIQRPNDARTTLGQQFIPRLRGSS